MTYDPDHRHVATPVATPVVPAAVVEPAHHDTVVVDHGPDGQTLARRLVLLVFGILQGLLLLRIVLALLGANSGNDVVSLVFGVTDPFVAPFRGIFDVDEASGSSGSTLDVVAIVALVGWTLVEALVLAIVGLADRRRRVV